MSYGLLILVVIIGVLNYQASQAILSNPERSGYDKFWRLVLVWVLPVIGTIAVRREDARDFAKRELSDKDNSPGPELLPRDESWRLGDTAVHDASDD